MFNQNFVFSLLLLHCIIWQVSNCSTLNSSNPVIKEPAVIRKPHPTLSYFDHLPVLGLWGKVARFLIEDERAFGLNHAYIDKELEKKLGAEKYKQLLTNVLDDHSLIFDIIEKYPELLSRVQDVKSPKTGKTLGEALTILKGIRTNPETSNELIRRLNNYQRKSLPNDQVHLVVGDDDGKNLEEIKKLALDPKTYEAISSSLMAALKEINFKQGFNSLKQIIKLLHSLFPESFEKVLTTFKELRDPKTGKPLGEGIGIVYRVFTNPATFNTVREMVNESKADSEKGMLLAQELFKQFSKFLEGVGDNVMKNLSTNPQFKNMDLPTKVSQIPVPDIQIPEFAKVQAKQVFDSIVDTAKNHLSSKNENNVGKISENEQEFNQVRGRYDADAFIPHQERKRRKRSSKSRNYDSRGIEFGTQNLENDNQSGELNADQAVTQELNPKRRSRSRRKHRKQRRTGLENSGLIEQNLDKLPQDTQDNEGRSLRRQGRLKKNRRVQFEDNNGSDYYTADSDRYY